jgi:hypothetical protein
MTAASIIQALTDKMGFEVVRVTDTPKYMRLIGRVQQPRMPDLLATLSTLLKSSVNANWGVDVSKFYFLPASASNVVFAWRFIFETQQEVLDYAAIERSIRSSPRASGLVGSGPLSEIKLTGSTALRNQPRNGKGADVFGKAVVGPLTLRR